MSDPKIALIDMDGTLCNYVKALSTKMQEVLGSEVSIWDPKYSKLHNLIKSQPGFWRDLEPLPFGMEVFNSLKQCGFEVHVLTKGPYYTAAGWGEKVEWCRRWVPGAPVTITEDKSLVYGKILVDDYPDYCGSWLSWRPRGLVIMPAYEYNLDFATAHPKQVVRGDTNNIEFINKNIALAFNRQPSEPLELIK